jgi:hypothetical protein
MTRPLVLALVLAGCGDDQPAQVELDSVRIDGLPTSIAPGVPLAFHVEVGGDVDELDLVVGIQAPGLPAPPDGPRFSQPGIAPATGTVYYLGSDGTWSTELAALPPRSGDFQPMLPETSVGEWRVFAAVKSHDAGPVVAAERRVIVTDRIALRVGLNKRWVDMREAVKVTARVAPADQAAALSLVGWLTLPDGQILALPELTPDLATNAVAPYGEATTLLDRDLELYGPGNYRVAVRLVDPVTGDVVAAGGGGFTVCANHGTITGTVVDSDRAALGAGASEASAILSPLDSAVTITAPIDETGAFTADVPVGRWLVDGIVVDGRGAHMLVKQAVVVGCEAAERVDLVADAPIGGIVVPPAAPPPPITLAHAEPVDDPILVRASAKINVGTDLEKQQRALALAKLWYLKVANTALPKVIMMSNAQAEIILETSVTRMKLGADSEQEQGVIGSVITTPEFQLLYEHNVRISKDRFQARYSPLSGTPYVLWVETLNGPSDAAQQLSALGARMGRHKDDPSRTLFEFLAPERQPVREPSVQITIPTNPIPGMPVRVEARLFDARTGKAADNTAWTMEFKFAPTVQHPHEELVVANIDSAGTARTSVLSTIEDRIRHVTVALIPKGGGRIGEKLRTIIFGTKHGEYPVSMPPVVQAKQEAQVRVKGLPPAQRSAPGHAAVDAILRVEGSRGTITGATNVAFDPQTNVFTTRFRAGDVAGLGEVRMIRTTDNMVVGRTYVQIDAPLTVTMTVDPQKKVLIGGQVHVLARVDLTRTGLVAPGVPVTFTRTGADGTLSTLSATTDANGYVKTTFTAGNTPGSAVITARAELDGVATTGQVALEIKAPCTNCPLFITSSANSVEKGGTLEFEANLVVTWSATGGTIDGDGRLTAKNAGGVWSVTATSVENPGNTATKEYIIGCDNTDLAGMYGGMVDMVIQSLGCGSTGMATGSLVVTPHGGSTPRFVDMEYTWDTMTPCSASFGVGEIAFPPRIQDGTCAVSTRTLFSGCVTNAISINAIGPGVSGLAGSYEKNFFMNGQCLPAEQGSFSMMRSQ